MESLKKLTNSISDLCEDEFYGKLIINFQHGKIVNIVKEDGAKAREAKTVVYQRSQR